MRARNYASFVLHCCSRLSSGGAASQLQLVLADMSRYLGRTVTIRDFSQEFHGCHYTDSALGCPSAPPMPYHRNQRLRSFSTETA
jgi:hypothetical protein